MATIPQAEVVRHVLVLQWNDDALQVRASTSGINGKLPADDITDEAMNLEKALACLGDLTE
jgi:hypothetical protein